MKIDPTGPAGPKSVRKREKTEKTQSKEFSKALEGKVASTHPVSGAGPISPVDAVVALQEVDNENEESRRAWERGDAILDHLDELRHGILAGLVNRDSLKELELMVKSKRGTITDPHLIEVLDQIELRASVELAKLESK